MYTHFFKITTEAMRTIKEEDKRIIKMKRIPSAGDLLVFDDDTMQKHLEITDVYADRTGLMKNYYLIEYKTKENDQTNGNR